MRFKSRDECKCSEIVDKLKKPCFRGMQDYHCHARAMVIGKTMIYSERLRDKHRFDNSMTNLVLRHDGGPIHDATFVVDKRLPEVVSRRDVNTSLRRELNSGRRRLKDIREKALARKNHFQVADMVAVAIHRRYGPRQDASYLAISSHGKSPIPRAISGNSAS